MNRDQKELLVNTLKQDFKNSDASFLIAINGMSVAKVQELRKGLRASGSKLKVAKNRLFKIAVEEVPCVKDLTPFFKNQLGVVFSEKDPVSTVKVIYDFAKENEQLKVIAGCFESRIVEKEALQRIARLPSREILLSQLCNVLMAPVTKLAQLVDALKVKKADEAKVE